MVSGRSHHAATFWHRIWVMSWTETTSDDRCIVREDVSSLSPVACLSPRPSRGATDFGGKTLVIRDVENEWVASLCARTPLPTSRLISATPLTPCLASGYPAGVVSRAWGGCIPRDRSFFLRFKSRRQPEGHWGPRSVAMPYHQLTARIIGWRSRCIGIVVRDCCNRFMSPCCAGRWGVLAFGVPRSWYAGEVQRRTSAAWIAGQYCGGRTVILEIKGVPTLLPLHEMQLQTCLDLSGLPAGLLFDFHASRPKDGLLRFVGCRGFVTCRGFDGCRRFVG
jgi:PD-(D/E)XK nuclease superfamily